jgi:hypothetical protein
LAFAALGRLYFTHSFSAIRLVWWPQKSSQLSNPPRKSNTMENISESQRINKKDEIPNLLTTMSPIILSVLGPLSSSVSNDTIHQIQNGIRIIILK